MIELTILKNSKIGLIIIGCCLACLVFAFVLLVGIDGYPPSEVSIDILQYSVYTVYTQFGFLLFSVMPIYLITSDYKEKTIVFYKKMKYTAVTYILKKLLSISMFFALGSFLVVVISAIYYMSLDNALLLFLKMANVTIYYLEISILFAYFLGHFIKAFAGGFFFWISSMIVVTTNPHGVSRFFAYYDALLERHESFEVILATRAMGDISVLYELAYNIVIGIGIVALVAVFRKRWVQYGV